MRSLLSDLAFQGFVCGRATAMASDYGPGNQCEESRVPVFVKQLGSVLGREMRAGSKGGGMYAFPEDLRVRQFPQAAEAVTA